jgi:hypothetical protein
VRLLLLSLALLALPARAEVDEDVKVQRYLADLYLGDSLELIQKLYPKAGDWPSHIEPRGNVTRVRVERRYAKKMPQSVDIMWVSLKNDRLVELQLIYSAAYSRRKSAEQLAGDFALIYGEPERRDNKFWWTDGKTVLRVMLAEIPALDEEGQPGKELRTSLQLMNADLFQRKY